MERFAKGENVLLGYNSQKPFEMSGSSPKTAYRNSFDFSDVFGGPPRRLSIQETRCNLSEAVDSEDNQWSELGQKPVFGVESLNRRRYQCDDFFDDIFRGDEFYSSPRTDRVPFGSTPASRVLSPVRPLPPKAEPFGTSLPGHFSLPAKLTKAADFPVFGSRNCSLHRNKDGISNGVNHQCTKSAFLSRFSSKVLGEDELKHDVRPCNNQTLSSQEFSLNIEESLNMSKFNETDMGGNLKKDTNSVEAPSNGNQFHFSIYKWAGRGVPLLTPLRGGSILKLKEKSKTERCSSSNGRIEDEDVARKPLKPNQPEKVDYIFLNHCIAEKTESLTLEGKTKGKENSQDSVEPCQVVDKSVPDMPESKTLNSIQFTVENVPASAIRSNKREELKQHPLLEDEREISTNTQDACKPELKPLRSFLNDEIAGQGSEETRKATPRESMVKKTKMFHLNVGLNGNSKNSIRKDASTTSPHVPAKESGDNLGGSRVKGKVKEFVKLFNQEDSLNPKISVDTQSQRSRWKSTVIYGADNGPSISTVKMSQKKHLPYMNKMPDTSAMLDENLEKLKNVNQNSHVRTSVCKTGHGSSDQKDAEPIPEWLPNGSKVTLGDIDDNIKGNILIEELSDDQDRILQTGEDFEDFQVADAKIRQWSNGKKGNIRSLLSTLQFIIWPGSGWKPVPLVDIIEGTAVKRAYQKALLCLHPDKLQQKGAASYQKYIAEKIFDVLQEAWDHFNSLGSL